MSDITGISMSGASILIVPDTVIIKSVKDGSIGKNSALEIITSSFGISKEKASKILDDVI